MEIAAHNAVPAMLALTGAVIAISALFSGALERRGVSLVLIFLAIGLLVGPYALGIASFGFESMLLQVAATISLTMVLFSDAVSIRPAELKTHAKLAAIILGPGTLATAAVVAAAAVWLLDVPVLGAAMLGAALASTDPVLLRAVLRDPKIPERVRQALRLESSLNDAVLVPIILIAMSLMAGGEAGVFRALLNLLVIGPVAGFIVGLLLVIALVQVRKRLGVRRDYESLYTLGIALTAFAVGEALHSSGYVAAFTAGIAVAVQDVELCDCFHDYGEATAEMALLLTFVALGGSLIWTGLELLDLRAVLFVAIALAARPIVLLLVMPRKDMRLRDRALVAWFGPRGLSTLLLILLPVFAGVPGSQQLFALASLVVLVSVVLHGLTPALLGKRDDSPVDELDALRISIDEVKQLIDRGELVFVVDVRTEAGFRGSAEMAAGALRWSADEAAETARRLAVPRDAYVVFYCACNAEQTSGRAAMALQRAGWKNARALTRGWDAWQTAGLPTQPIGRARQAPPIQLSART